MKNKNIFNKYLIIIVVIFLSAFILFFFFWKANFYNKAYPNTKINNIDLSGLNKSEIENILKDYTYKIEKEGIVFKKDNIFATLKIGSDSIDSGPSYPFLNINIKETVDSYFDNRDNKSFILFIKNIIFKHKPNKDNVIVFNLEKDLIKLFIIDSFSNLVIPYENAFFYISEDDNNLNISLEKIGKAIDYNDAYNKIINNLSNLINENIELHTLSVYPEFKKEDLNLIKNDVIELIENSNTIQLIFSDNLNNEEENIKWDINSNTLISWIGVKNENEKTEIYFDENKIKLFLEDKIAPEIKKEIILPRFEMENNKIKNWQIGKDGRELNINESINNIKNNFKNENWQINLTTSILSVDSFASENNFKIEEIIGTGHSSFIGSSANRIENIRVGSEFLHGLLIKPGEEFSLINNLGEIDKESGYLPELVIKDGKTIPEYGGGLCQVGTTLFRAALQSGLPITERRNHSYRVSYYEPAGTDATIYDPWPDFKFINDTKEYILLQYRMEGYDLYYDIWGVKDGREVTVTDPVIYNIVKPEDTKIIETDELEPGVKKCTESAHNGADAYFDYKVIYPEGSMATTTVEQRFSSHYVPWQAVCLIGKEDKEEEKEENNINTQETINSSTENNITENINNTEIKFE